MRHLVRLIRINLRLIAFGTLLLVALYVVLARSALAFLPDYRAQLETFLSNSLGQSVRIGVLEGQWVGFDPVIVIRDLSFFEPDKAQLNEVRIRLAILRSLLARDVRLRSIQVDQTGLEVAHRDDGSWVIGGVELALSGSQQNPDIDRFLSYLDGAQVVLSDSRIDFIDTRERMSVWRVPDLAVNYEGDALHARGLVIEPDGVQPVMNFTVRGEWDDELGLMAQLYAEFRSGADFASLLEQYEWSELALEQIDLSGRLWLDFADGAVQSWHTTMQMSELQWQLADESMPPVRNLIAEAAWESGEKANELYFSGLSFEWLSQQCGPMNGRVIFDNENIDTYLDMLDVGCASQLVTMLDVASGSLGERLQISEPEGKLRHLRVLKQDGEWRFDAALEAVGLKAYESTPSGRNINGYVYANAEGGGVIFDSEGFELAFPTLFLDAWKSRRGQGAVKWQLENDDVRVFSEGIRLYMPDNSLVYGDFELILNGPAHEDYLMLQIALQDIDFEKVPAFVPYYAVGSELHDWLRRSLVSGTATSGIYVGYGVVETQSPENSFTSSIHVNTQKGVLHFAEGWPNLEDLAAEIDIQNGQLDIRAENARIHKTSLQRLSAHKPEAKEGGFSTLTAKATTRIAPKNLRYWLRESPIAENTRHIAEQVSVDSDVDTQITISVPMEDGKEVGYNVAAQLKQAVVKHLPSRLTFTEVNGVLDVSSDNGVRAKEISASLFDEPVTININTDYEAIAAAERYEAFAPSVYLNHKVIDTREVSDTRSTTRIAMKGKATASAIAKHFAMTSPPGLSGRFDYRCELHIPPEAVSPPYFELVSDTKGLIRDWPAPLNKGADLAEALYIKTLIDGEDLNVSARLSNAKFGQSTAQLRFEQGELKTGQINIGEPLARTSEQQQGLTINVGVPAMVLDPWLDFIGRWNNVATSEKSAPLLRQVNAEIGGLEAFGYPFTNQIAQIRSKGDGWLIELSGPEAKGRVTVPSDDPMVVTFSELHLKERGGGLTGETLDPSGLPALRFKTERLTLADKNYGALSFVIEPNDKGAIFRELDWRLLGNRASGQLNWQLEDGHHSSILTLDLMGRDIDALAKHLDWKSPLTSNDMEGSLAWVWPHAPSDFALGAISGSLRVVMKDGRLKTADEKTGALRLFGIFNAEAIGRRLKLDFSDLYKSGVSYDELTLNARIDQGNLRIEDKLRITGPSSKYTITGATDLGKEQLDMEMVVELPVSQNVPLAALLLGAPQIGGAVWLIDKILGEPLSQITTARYTIKGPWSNPVLELKQVLNANK